MAFFRGTSLRPIPPAKSKSKDTRTLGIHHADDPLGEAPLAAWVTQQSLLPGERTRAESRTRGERSLAANFFSKLS
jgi:hypothetical protein